MFSWNAGGLNTETYQELLTWLQVKRIDLACVQDVRWTGERTWRTHGYSVIQSGVDPGSKTEHCGLLCFVSDRICSFDDIAYSTILPGRLLHLKCKLTTNSLDLITIYQHPDVVSQTRPQPLAARGEVWIALDMLLHRLARRNIQVLAGDFNCPMDARGSASALLPPDHHEFVEITKKYFLGTVRAHDHSPTYIGPLGTSSIDHILMPKAQMDARNRRGCAVADFPVASWRMVRDHVPIVCSIVLGWRCWYSKPAASSKITKSDLTVISEAWKSNTPGIEALQATLSEQIASFQPDLDALPLLTKRVAQHCHQYASHQAPVRPSTPTPHRSIMAHLWHTYAELRKPRLCAMKSIFSCWRNSIRLHQLKKRLSASCRRVKVQRLERAVSQAEDASRRHDSRALFSIIRQLTPKQPYRPIRLRGTGGEALTASEECHMFETHFASIFQTDFVVTPKNAGSLEYMPFTQAELAHAFAQAPIAKAVGPSSLPNLLLRVLSEPLAQWLWPALQHAWCDMNDPQVPTSWRDAWLVLLAKRQVRSPKDVRPIALTDSIGKTVLGLSTQTLNAQVFPQTCHLPLFAYLPSRGTLEALQFVCAHCRQVRQACDSNSKSYWKRLQGGPPQHLTGGLILSLDMCQAFDRLPRATLADGLQQLGIDPFLSQLFMKWLHQATYHFQHRRTHCSVETSQGVRQGCKASPIEWTIFLTVLLQKLDAKLSSDPSKSWVKKHLITYADDLLALWTLHATHDLLAAIQQIGTFLDILEALGMHVNFTKSVLIMRLSGRSFNALKKKLIHKQANLQGLLIPRPMAPQRFYHWLIIMCT